MPRDRRERRQAKRETIEMLRMLMKVDLEFNNAMLSDGEDEYADLYHDYLTKWNEVLRRIDARCYKIASPNRTYFADSYSAKSQ